MSRFFKVIALAAVMAFQGAGCLTFSEPTSTPSPTATPDVAAMVKAAIDAVLDGTATATPTATPTLRPTNTAVPTAIPIPTPTPLSAPTNTPRPQPTAPLQPTVTLQRLHSGLTVAELVARLRPSVAHIRTAAGSGSGFVYDRSGLVATNAHVVDCCRDVTVTVNNQRYPGTVLGRDDRADLAVVRINSGGEFVPASLGNAWQVEVGDEVVALGFPLRLGDDLTATRGIVSSHRTVAGYEQFQHDASINPGNSGGPLINLDGLVIGMNSWKRSDAEGIGFALSVSEIAGRLAGLASSVSAAPLRPHPTATRRAVPTITPRTRPTPTRRPTLAPLPTATPVPATDPFQQVSAGSFATCGLKTDYRILCWGSGDYGMKGDFQQISAGNGLACGVKADGRVACSGLDFEGQSTPPSGVFRQVSAGGFHTCGVKTDGRVACWGYNRAGQASPPTETFQQVSAGEYHTCGVQTDGRVACWGDNRDGRATPPTGTFQQVSAGQFHTCGVKTDGVVVCWGDNRDGNLTPPAGTFRQVSAGGTGTCGVKTDRQVDCWGFIGIPPAGTFRQVSVGQFHACGVKTDDSVVCWGKNDYGQATPP